MNEKTYIIDIAAPCDADAIAEAEEICFSDPWSSGGIAHFSSCESAFVICAKDEGGAICGYAIGSFAAGEGELLRIAVLPDRRRNGLGRAILDKFICLMSFRNVTDLFLEVRASNSSAIELYKSTGFEEYTVRRNYYKNPAEDAVMMRLDLGE